jgi:AcrR family transcriptional regulator
LPSATEQNPDEATESVVERVLQVALEEFAEHGFDGVTMRDLAKKTGLNLSSIYFKFKDKRDIYMQACLRALADANNAPSAAMRSTAPPRERLLEVITAIATVNLQHRSVLKLMSRELLEADREGLLQIHDKVMADSFDRFLVTIEEATGKPASMRQPVAVYSLIVAMTQYPAFGGRIEEDLREIVASPEALARHVIEVIFPDVAAALFGGESSQG